MNASGPEYLVSVRRDITMKSTLFNDFKEILLRFNPEWGLGWDAELDLGSKILYDGIGLYTGKDTIGQELASITPINVEKTVNSWYNILMSLKYKRKTWIKPSTKPTNVSIAQDPVQGNINGASNPTSQSLETTSTTTTNTNTNTNTTTTTSTLPPPKLRRQIPNPFKKKHRIPKKGYKMSQSTLQNFTNLPHSEIEEKAKIDMISNDILVSRPTHSPISPIVASFQDKFMLSALTNLPPYLLHKMSSLEYQTIPLIAPWWKKALIILRNITLVALPRGIKSFFDLIQPLDWICFCLVSGWYSWPERLLGLLYFRTSDSALKNKKMVVEKAAFKALGIVMVAKYLFTIHGTMRDGIFGLITGLSRWIKMKGLLMMILTKRFFRQIFVSMGLLTPLDTSSIANNDENQDGDDQWGDLDVITNDNTNNNNNNQSNNNNSQQNFTSYHSQLTPHERHKIRKRLFSYVFQVTNVKSGEHYKNDDIFEYYHQVSSSTLVHLSAYDLAISSNTDGAWDTSAIDDESSHSSDDYGDYDDPFGSSSSDDDDDIKKSNSTKDDVNNIELYIKNGRKNKQLYLSLVTPSIISGTTTTTTTTTTKTTKTTKSTSNNNNDSDDSDDSDDGVLYLDNSGTGYHGKNSFTHFNHNNMTDDDDSDDDDNNTTNNNTHTNSTQFSTPTPSRPLTLMKSSCGVCLCKARATTSTTCGHIFCWGCVLGYVQVKRECPTCRTACSPSELLRLFQFG